MSARSQLVLEAIFAKTNVSAVVGSGKLTAIYDTIAKPGASFPYGIIQRQASEPIEYTFGPTVALQGDIWTLKVVTDTGTASASPQKHAEALLAAWVSTLGTSLTIAGGTVVWCQPLQDMPGYQEQVNERWVYHRGTQIRIRTE